MDKNKFYKDLQEIFIDEQRIPLYLAKADLIEYSKTFDPFIHFIPIVKGSLQSPTAYYKNYISANYFEQI